MAGSRLPAAKYEDLPLLARHEAAVEREDRVGGLAGLSGERLGQRLGGGCPQDPQLEAECLSRDLELFGARSST
ncbi:MAG: hypothetical protein H0V51_02155 [Chloroflexi bacterium]|nr:hypothetical protein [Chloroflexota bacterium]